MMQLIERISREEVLKRLNEELSIGSLANMYSIWIDSKNIIVGVKSTNDIIIYKEDGKI